jgi:hypothetical protein
MKSMKIIKKYNHFINENMNIGLDSKYGIHDWIEDLKDFEWGRKPIKDLEKWTNHFIGDGYYNKIKNHVDRLFTAINKVDVDSVEDRLLMDVFDNLPPEKVKWVSACIAYGNIENYNKEIQYKYNGLLTVRNRDEKDYFRVMVHIIKEIIYPTFYIGSYPSIMLRQSDESYYVTDKKWQCVNFNIDNFEELGIKVGAEFATDDSRGRKCIIGNYDISKKKDYSVDKIIEMNAPCIVIEIGQGDNYMKGKMNLVELENQFDEVLPSILPSLDYSDVIFDHARGTRQFDSTEIYDYTVKILLNY